MSCAPSCWRRSPPEEPLEVRVYTRGGRDSGPEGNEMVATNPQYALEQARDAVRGGDGWLSHDETTPAAGGGHAGRKPRDRSHVGGGGQYDVS
jgi:hypothetical protein